LEPGKEYLLSYWCYTDRNNEISPTALEKFVKDNDIGIKVAVLKDNGIAAVNIGNYVSNSPVIEGWQKREYSFIVPQNAEKILLQFNNKYTFNIDDIRLLPYNGNMETFVYEPATYNKIAVLDQNNFAVLYKYDEEGKVFQLIKETTEGLKTLQVKQSFMKPNKP
jgi:hypothetical protein